MKLSSFMPRVLMAGLLGTSMLPGWGMLSAAPAPDSEAAREITHLIASVRSSASTFIRNGTTHPGPAAADHMMAKADYYRKDIKTAEDFIRLAATKSALSGKPYQVQHTDGKVEPCGPWLTQILQVYRVRKLSGG